MQMGIVDIVMRKKMQTKKHSLIESCTNILIGYQVALVSQLIIFPFFDIHIPLSDNMIIGGWFTIISLIRSYILRRLFNKVTIASITFTAGGHGCKDKKIG